MYSIQNTSESARHLGNSNPEHSRQNQLTSLSVVNALGREIAHSPAQRSLHTYSILERGQGKPPTSLQGVWLCVRRLGQQMNTLEQLTQSVGKKLSERDCQLAASKLLRYIPDLVELVSQQEVQHPSFRMELTEHLENMIRWDPENHAVWRIAYLHLQDHEHLKVNGQCINRQMCLDMYLSFFQ
jgi:hypothetical protein